MDTRSIEMYRKALRDGKEKVYNIRVMVVGPYDVGKTTLTKRLLGKDVNICERKSTEGIDIQIECCKVSLTTGEWITQEKSMS
jgi:GTPase SAR1 family protein